MNPYEPLKYVETVAKDDGLDWSIQKRVKLFRFFIVGSLLANFAFLFGPVVLINTQAGAYSIGDLITSFVVLTVGFVVQLILALSARNFMTAVAMFCANIVVVSLQLGVLVPIVRDHLFRV
jgi:hypothetical protein